MKRRVIAGILTGVVLALFPGGDAPAQETRLLAGQKPLEHEVTVSLKLVQVYVTDRSGKAVTDLDRSEFLLYEDGISKEITEFEKHVFLVPGASGTIPSSAPAGPTAPLLNRKFYVLIDFARNDNFGVKRARDTALHFLDSQIQPDDEVGLLSYRSYGGLVLHENLTTDLAKIREILAKIKDIPGYGMSGGVPLWGDGGPGGTGGGAGSGRLDARAQARDEQPAVAGIDLDWEHVKESTYRFTLAMQDLAKSLRYVPGFKNILFFSSGVMRDLLYDYGDSRIRMEHEAMVKELSSANCSLFTVNAEGQRAFLKNPEERGDHSLQIMARESGGRYFHDVNKKEKIASEIQDMTGNYYVLGFYVDEEPDGKFHEIKVEVRREKCRVYAQGGYFSPKLFKKFSKFEKELHLYDMALAEKPVFGTPLRIPLCASAGPAGESPNLLLLSEIAVDVLDDVLGEKAETVVLVLDGNNAVVEEQRGELDRKALGERWFFPFALATIPPGEYKCRVVFRNLETGRAAVGSAGVTVAAEPGTGLSVRPPLLFIPDNPAFYLGFSKAAERDRENEIAPLRKAFPEITGRLTPVLDVLESGVTTLAALIIYSRSDDADGAMAFSASFLDERTGEKAPASLTVAGAGEPERTSAAEGSVTGRILQGRPVFAVIKLPFSKPGVFRLVLEALDPVTGEKAEASRTIEIR